MVRYLHNLIDEFKEDIPSDEIGRIVREEYARDSYGIPQKRKEEYYVCLVELRFLDYLKQKMIDTYKKTTEVK